MRTGPCLHLCVHLWAGARLWPLGVSESGSQSKGRCLCWGQTAQSPNRAWGDTLCPTGPGWSAAGASGVLSGRSLARAGSDVLSGGSRRARPVGLRAAVGSLRLRARAAEEGAPQNGQASRGPAHKQGWAKLVPIRCREYAIRCGCKPRPPQSFSGAP